MRSLGSGFIIDSSGLIITNNHVVAGAKDIRLKLYKKDKEYQAEVLGRDPKTDLALLKINTDKELPYLKLDVPMTSMSAIGLGVRIPPTTSSP